MKLDLLRGWRWWTAATAGVALGAAGWLLLRGAPDERSGPLSMAVLRRRVAEMTDSGSVRVRHLGDGIVELVGRVDDPDLISSLLAEASSVEGVEVVVNRLWGVAPAADGGRNRPIDAPSDRR